MAKDRVNYICQECDFTTVKWMGRCSSCGAWNSLKEKKEKETTSEIRVSPSSITEIKAGIQSRIPSGINELDRVLGGGIVPGSLILLGGAPGIGKSTLILQVASLFSKNMGRVLYVSGEESARQIKLRAERLHTIDKRLFILSEVELDQISAILTKDNYDLVIIDSIQTIYDPHLDSAPGSVNQLKAITNIFMKIAKTKEIPIFLIGHVNKEGEIAGPKVLEHLVDTVLQIEGDSHYAFRILRGIKNRFGSTNEVGVFEMKNTGMQEVLNPSQAFLEERAKGVAGSVIVPILEGSRPILVEVQSLVASATFGNPQRLTTGVDYKRVSILLAVLEKKAGFNFQKQDVNLNITGGLKVDEPALDLGIVSAIISSFREYTLPTNLAVVGEVGLAGEVRAVSQIAYRLTELKKLGFKTAVIPQGNLKGLTHKPGIKLLTVANIYDLLNKVFA